MIVAEMKSGNFLHRLMRISVLVILLPLLSPAQGFHLKVKISGSNDSVLYLANYFADKQYITDTLRRFGKEWYRMKSDTMIPGGLYVVAGQAKNRYFEFLVNNEPELIFETRSQEPVNAMKIKGSAENTAFFDYVRFLHQRQKEIDPLQKALQRVEISVPDSTAILQKQIDRINADVQSYMKALTQKHDGMFLSAFIRASRDPEIPETPLLPTGRPDSAFPYRYFKAHYFDNLPLGDARLLRTPFYHQRVNQYFSKMLLQHPDSIIAEVQRLMPEAGKSRDTYRYLVWFLTNYTERSEIMGMDAAFVYMVENYYANGEMDFWVNSTVKENLVKKAKKLKPILIGKKAPELIMMDTLMRPVSLHQLKARYTILFFWDPACGHCKKEIPKLKDLVKNKGEHYGIKVFAVCSDTNMREMKHYIRRYGMDWVNVNGPRTYTGNYHELYDVFSTPVMYLLDEKKNIIAKRLFTDQIELFIERQSKNEGHAPLQIQEE
jgi:thiol-disulfide isomerase/thioredoxin